MKKAAIVGATGLVGQQLLQLLLDDDRYDAVHSIGRRRIDIESGKLVQHVISLDAIEKLQVNERIDDTFCTLGTTIKVAKTQENFSRVDRDYVCAFAGWARANGATAIAVNSSVGADPDSANFYLKTKGEMERCVQQAGIESVTFVRPSLLVPSGRRETRPGEVFSYRVMQLFGWLLVGRARRYRPVRPTAVARAMLAAASTHSPGVTIVESEAIEKTE